MTYDSHTPLGGLRVAVTGGTSGLGLALVETLHARGAHVAFIARHADRVSRIATRFPGTHGIVGDVSLKEQIHPIALRITAALGGLDVLINNASSLGPVPLAPLADTECEDLEAALATNLLGPFRLTRALLGALGAAARQGRFWNEELAGLGIRVQAIDPGDMDTPLHALAVPDADPATLKRPEESAREMIGMIEAYAWERSRSGETRRHADPTPA